MPNPYFQFKQFTVRQDKTAMKVGTDGVLLGAWAKVNDSQRILDVGTGTGVVALMLAQRSKAFITAIEVDEKAAEQAAENVANSPWHGRIEVIKADFKQYISAMRYDVIVSNPPYFMDSLKCPNKQRAMARHTQELHYEELLKGVAGLLANTGSLTIIIPSDVADRVVGIALETGLYPCERLNIVTKPGTVPKRCLIAFRFGKQTCRTDELLIELSRHQYSEAYIALTKDYYLNM